MRVYFQAAPLLSAWTGLDWLADMAYYAEATAAAHACPIVLRVLLCFS